MSEQVPTEAGVSMSEQVPTNQLPEVELTLQQAERAAEMVPLACYGHDGYLAARLVVHLQDQVAKLERCLSKAECPRSPSSGEPVPMSECIDNEKCICGAVANG